MGAEAVRADSVELLVQRLHFVVQPAEVVPHIFTLTDFIFEQSQFVLEQPQSLALEKPEKQVEVVYPAEKGRALFDFKFSEDTELSGYMKLSLHFAH